MYRYLIAFAVLLIASIAHAGVPADFEVQPVTPPFRLADAKGKFVALHFLLKTECPYCLKHVHTYATRAAELPNVVNVFLKPDDLPTIQKWVAKLPPGAARPTIYQDPDGKWADAFGIPSGYRFHGIITHFPALVLIKPDGTEALRYVGKSNSDRMPFDEFSAKVAELSKSPTTKPAAATGH